MIYVTGKCITCAQLSHARRTFRDSESRTIITLMHALHRTSYMGERREYAFRKDEALRMPGEYCSIISDGMAQSHCELPHFGNACSFGTEKLTQHFQGCLNHGRNFTIYRTFHNVVHDANAQIHCFLLSLEKTATLQNGKLPDTIYYQIDGGSENVAKEVILICELLVARRLTLKVVLTRLMVGHTHEDIDARFGTLWLGMRNRHVYSPQDYVKVIHGCYGDKLPIFVQDIWVVPNYKNLIKPYMDKKFGRYAKTVKDKNWTQLQFKFEAIEPSEHFPLGVKTTYRRYCADEVVEIIKTSENHVGFMDQHVTVSSFPSAKSGEDGNPARPEGMYILQELPTKDAIQPTGFKAGSRAELENTIRKVKTTLPSCSQLDWEEFCKLAPKTDDVNDYLKEFPDAM